MKTPKKIINFLDKAGVKYDVIEHRKVYTALDKSKTLRVKESMVGKTVVLSSGSYRFLVLTSADSTINLDKLAKLLSKEIGKEVKKISFASEKWIKENIKGMKQGVTPPFGDIWGLPVFIENSFLKNAKIIINSGVHTESIKMTPAVFRKVNNNLVGGVFSKKRRGV
ncbi:MAG: YbaK/EbsC family protein [Candidatus Pacebacteria bacterium]|nr:YbaK/EbsC family protein [Candidatus Paceibacterota bacterium]